MTGILLAGRGVLLPIEAERFDLKRRLGDQVSQLQQRLSDSQNKSEAKYDRLESKLRHAIASKHLVAENQETVIGGLQTENEVLRSANQSAEHSRMKNNKEKAKDLEQIMSLYDVIKKQKQIMDEQAIQCKKFDVELQKLLRQTQEGEREKRQLLETMDREKHGFELSNQNLQAQLREKTEESGRHRAQLEATTSELSEETNNLEKRLSSLQTVLEKSEHDRAELTHHNAKLTHNYEDQIKGLRDDVSKLEIQLSQLKGEQKAETMQNERLQVLQAENKQTNAVVLELRQKLLETSESRSRMEGELMMSKQALERLEKTAHNFETERVSWLTSRDAMQKELQQLTVQLGQLQTMYKETEQKSIEHLEGRARVQEALAKEMKETQRLSQSIDDLKRELALRDQQDREREVREQRERSERAAREETERRDRRDAVERETANRTACEAEKQKFLDEKERERTGRDQQDIAERQKREKDIREEGREQSEKLREEGREKLERLSEEARVKIEALHTQVHTLSDQCKSFDQRCKEDEARLVQMTHAETRNHNSLLRLAEKINVVRDKGLQMITFQQWRHDSMMNNLKKEHAKEKEAFMREYNDEKEAALEAHKRDAAAAAIQAQAKADGRDREQMAAIQAQYKADIDTVQTRLQVTVATLENQLTEAHALVKQLNQARERHERSKARWMQALRQLVGDNLASSVDGEDDGDDFVIVTGLEKVRQRLLAAEEATGRVMAAQQAAQQRASQEHAVLEAAQAAQAAAAAAAVQKQTHDQASSPMKGPVSPAQGPSKFLSLAARAVAASRNAATAAPVSGSTASASFSVDAAPTSVDAGSDAFQLDPSKMPTGSNNKHVPAPSVSPIKKKFVYDDVTSLPSTPSSSLSGHSSDSLDILPPLPHCVPTCVPRCHVHINRNAAHSKYAGGMSSLEKEINQVERALELSKPEHLHHLHTRGAMVGRTAPVTPGKVKVSRSKIDGTRIWNELAELYQEIEERAAGPVVDEKGNNKRVVPSDSCHYQRERDVTDMAVINDFTGSTNCLSSHNLRNFEDDNLRTAKGLDNILTQMEMKSSQRKARSR